MPLLLPDESDAPSFLELVRRRPMATVAIVLAIALLTSMFTGGEDAAADLDSFAEFGAPGIAEPATAVGYTLPASMPEGFDERQMRAYQRAYEQAYRMRMALQREALIQQQAMLQQANPGYGSAQGGYGYGEPGAFRGRAEVGGSPFVSGTIDPSGGGNHVFSVGGEVLALP